MNNSGLSIMYLEVRSKREKLAEYLREEINSLLVNLDKGLPIYSIETADIQRYTEFITEERLLKKLLDKMEEQNGKEKNA